MGHATELITLDIYGDNREIIADCVDEIQPFIDEVLPIKEVDKQLEEELLEIEVPAEDYFKIKAVVVSIKYQFGSQNETRRRERTNVPTCAYTFPSAML